MSTTTQRPTPETDALHAKQGLTHASYRDFARKLERQLDEARQQLEAIREAIGVAQTELNKITAACHGALDGARLEGSASVEYSQGFASVKSMAMVALAKLQPHLPAKL